MGRFRTHYWWPPYTYDSAMNFLTCAQKNRKAKQATRWMRLVRDEHDPMNGGEGYDLNGGEDSVTLFYGQEKWGLGTSYITYYPNNTFRTWVFDAHNIQKWTTPPVFHYTRRGVKYTLIGNETRPLRMMKCRSCHGYVWQGDEVESLLWKMMTSPLPSWHDLSGRPAMGMRPVRTAQNPEAYRHRNPCYRCQGTGRAMYGGTHKPIGLPWKPGMLYGPDGLPIEED